MKLTDKFKACAGIYIFTNLVNGKIYVGESSNIQKRMSRHKSSNSEQAFHKAVKKYGIENFKVYVEYLPSFPKEDLWTLEEQLILKFNSLAPKGYNVCSRGSGIVGFKFSEDSKKRMSEMRKGRVKSEEHRRKISKAHIGRTVSKETGNKISRLKKGQPVHENCKNASHLATMKSVAQINPETLEVVKIWSCIRDATEFFTKKREGSCIVGCLSGRYKTSYGFKWKYV